jgi:hypothetical protein
MSSAYSPAQTKAYLDYIGLPESRQTQNEQSLAFLTDLHTHTLSTVPYENLSFHYSEKHTNSLDPQEIFRKIVLDRRGRGGYCMEISILCAVSASPSTRPESRFEEGRTARRAERLLAGSTSSTSLLCRTVPSGW